MPDHSALHHTPDDTPGPAPAASASPAATATAPRRPARWRKAWPLAALAALLLILAGELFVVLRSDLFTDGIYWTTVAKRRLLQDPAHQDDVVIFGDSRAFSLQPKVVAEALGLGPDARVTNYSWAYMGADGYRYFLDAYLHSKRPPRMILVNPLPEIVALPPRMLSLEDNPSHRTRLYTALPAPALLSTFIQQRNWDMAWGLVKHVSMPPSLARRDRVWAALKSLARGRGFPPLTPIDQHQIEGMTERGAYLMHLDHIVHPAVFKQAERLNGPYAAHDNKEAFASFEQFLARARAEGIQVRVVGIPFAASTYDRYDQSGALAAYRRLLEKWARQFPNFATVEPILPRWPDHLFGDAGHLNLAGDRLYQEELRKLLISNY